MTSPVVLGPAMYYGHVLHFCTWFDHTNNLPVITLRIVHNMLQAAYSVIWPEDPVLELSQEVVKLKMEIAHIDTDLLKVIGDSDVKDIMLFAAGKIKNLVDTKQQVII